MTTEYKVCNPTNTDSTKDELRRRAVKRLQAKAGFWTHLAVYLAVNAFLIMIWFFTGKASSGPFSRSLVGASGWWRTPGLPSDGSQSQRSEYNARWSTCVCNRPSSMTRSR
jgi:hypothetical protein